MGQSQSVEHHIDPHDALGAFRNTYLTLHAEDLEQGVFDLNLLICGDGCEGCFIETVLEDVDVAVVASVDVPDCFSVDRLVQVHNSERSPERDSAPG